MKDKSGAISHPEPPARRYQLRLSQADERLLKALQLLVGAKVQAVGVNRDGMPLLSLVLADGKREMLMVSCDGEGNGPGALLGLWELARDRGAM